MNDLEERLMRLEGHVSALTILSRIVMPALCNSQQGRDPVEVAEEIERETFSTLQFGHRPVGEVEDQIWEFAVESLKAEFAILRARIQPELR